MSTQQSTTFNTEFGPVTLAKVGADFIVSNLVTGADDGFKSFAAAMAFLLDTYGPTVTLVEDES